MSKAKTNATKTAKTSKATKSVAVVETESVEVEPTEAVVMDTPNDITAAEPTEQVCSVHGGDPLPINADNFSPLQTGGFRKICKPCQTAKANEWTSERADLRKAQALAVKYVNAGIPVLKPSAKEWTPETVLMTIPYSTLDGKIVPEGTEGATFVPARVASEVYAEFVQARTDAREAKKAEQEATAKLEREARAAERAETKRLNDEKKAEDKRIADEARAKRREEKALEASNKAEADRLEREAKQLEKANKRQADILAQAEEKRLAAEKATAEKTAKILEETEATLASLKGENAMTATV